MVLIDDDTLARRTEAHPDGARRVAETQGGTPIPAETIRRITCDTGIIPIVLGGDGPAAGPSPGNPTAPGNSTHPETTSMNGATLTR